VSHRHLAEIPNFDRPFILYVTKRQDMTLKVLFQGGENSMIYGFIFSKLLGHASWIHIPKIKQKKK
jgi:hypothetical protein